jgi:hypothetical protein
VDARTKGRTDETPVSAVIPEGFGDLVECGEGAAFACGLVPAAFLDQPMGVNGVQWDSMHLVPLPRKSRFVSLVNRKRIRSLHVALDGMSR